MMHVTGETISGGTRVLQQSALFQTVDDNIKDCTGASPTFMSECSCQHVVGDPMDVPKAIALSESSYNDIFGDGHIEQVAQHVCGGKESAPSHKETHTPWNKCTKQ
eukprot:5473456-Amphidinium_carterae.2